jgi:hypothetical protein
VCPRHNPRFEPSIMISWEQLYASVLRSSADLDLVEGLFQVETARRMGIDVVEDLDLDADCNEMFVSRL